MDYAILLLKQNIKDIERRLKSQQVMQHNMSLASHELHKVTQLKRAIKILKLKNKN